MNTMILTTFDWVPEMPRGFVRDIRVRWALEEAGLPYRVESMPFRDRERGAFRASALRPGAVAEDGDISIFESGAILLHLGDRSDALMPSDPRGRPRRSNGCSRRSTPSRWRACPGRSFSNDNGDTTFSKQLDEFLGQRLNISTRC